MFGLKKAVVCLIGSSMIVAGAAGTGCFFVDKANKYSVESDKIYTSFLNSPEFTQHVSEDVASILKQKGNSATVLNIMKDVAPETYTLYISATNKYTNYGTGAIFDSFVTAGAIGAAVYSAASINEERKKKSNVAATWEQRRVDVNGKVTVKQTSVRKVDVKGNIIEK
ncbi:MAG: hypothetical protein K2K31_02020 [Clostridia bacterium]|nr:hypothetical protein [Clostridia bacterium]